MAPKKDLSPPFFLLSYKFFPICLTCEEFADPSVDTAFHFQLYSGCLCILHQKQFVDILELYECKGVSVHRSIYVADSEKLLPYHFDDSFLQDQGDKDYIFRRNQYKSILATSDFLKSLTFTYWHITMLPSRCRFNRVAPQCWFPIRIPAIVCSIVQCFIRKIIDVVPSVSENM